MVGKNVVLAVVGVLLLALNVGVVGSVATGAVEGAVTEMFSTYPKDGICSNDDCSELKDDWLISTSERDYYAWNLTNLDEMMADPRIEPIYEKAGPVTYEISTERTFLGHDAEAGTITFSETKSYEWKSGTPSSTPVTALNILYEPQRIGATSLFIDILGQMSKASFCSDMVQNDMEVGVPSKRTADALDGLGLNSTMAWADHAYFDATDPGDSTVSIALTDKWGPALFVGLGLPSASNSMARATLFGYVAEGDDVGTVNESETSARDQELYALVAAEYAQRGGGDENWDDDIDEVENRFYEVSGARLSNHTVLNDILYGMDGGTPRGLLVADSAGLMQGFALFLLAVQANPFAVMSDYHIGITDLQKVGYYAGDWFLDETEFPLILVGGSGTLNASAFQFALFASENPLTGGYADASLNVGGIWGSGMMVGYGSTGYVDLTYAQTENILYGPMGIAADGTIAFLYGEVTGHTLPVDPETMMPMTGGTELTWDNELVAQIYGIDTGSAAALRYFTYDLMFQDQIPGILNSLFGEEATGYPGATKFVSHTIDEWLFGWRDPLMAQLGGDLDDESLGWQSLETNKTYFGSPNVSTGDGTTYTICTGENLSCDKGETLLQDGSEYLFWRTPEMEESSYGQLPAESLSGTSGGFLTGEGDLLNLGDYAISAPVRQADGEHLGMPVEVWTASLAPGERSIQAKLTNQQSVTDIFPGTVPIYFSADVELKVQHTARIIVAGESTSHFYLDTRFMSEQAASPPTEADLQPLFMIVTGGGADQETVDAMSSGIIQNQNRMTYWTNFDTGPSGFFIDYVTALIYLAGIGLLGAGIIGIARAGPEGRSKPEEFDAVEAGVEQPESDGEE
jgi:hypothetical protein